MLVRPSAMAICVPAVHDRALGSPASMVAGQTGNLAVAADPGYVEDDDGASSEEWDPAEAWGEDEAED